jgi:hypothetical protein
VFFYPRSIAVVERILELFKKPGASGRSGDFVADHRQTHLEMHTARNHPEDGPLVEKAIGGGGENPRLISLIDPDWWESVARLVWVTPLVQPRQHRGAGFRLPSPEETEASEGLQKSAIRGRISFLRSNRFGTPPPAFYLRNRRSG